MVKALAGQVAPLVAAEVSASITAREASPWLTFEELVEYTKMPEGTLRKQCAHGVFKGHGGKRKLYYRPQVDEALLASRNELREAS